MSNIQFEEETFKSRTILGEPSSPKMVKTLLKMGIVKNEQQAGHLLLAIAAFFFLLAIYISYSFLFASNTPKLTPEQERQGQEFMERVRKGQSPVPVTQTP
jgi:hypothetical protein